VRVEVHPDPLAVAARAAQVLARAITAAVDERGVCSVAFSGGRTPRRMLEILTALPLPWERLHVFQVDERIAPKGSDARNLTDLESTFLERSRIPKSRLHAMPVEAADLVQAAAHYAQVLEQFAGSPPVLDLIHLGLGTDGHAASLLPRDPVLAVKDRDVAISGMYRGYRRMTLTLPPLNRTRCVLWVVCGSEKAESAAQLYHGEQSIPAGAVCRKHALLLLDQAAAPLMAKGAGKKA